MSLHKEIEFENDICNHLAANGWLYAEGDAKGYDTPRALFPADVLAWVQIHPAGRMGRFEQNPRCTMLKPCC
jgi:hypothetical protein